MNRAKIAEAELERKRRRLAPSQLKRTYLTPFPQRAALVQTINQSARRIRRISARFPSVNQAALESSIREDRRLYGSVEIARNGAGWWLAYDGKRSTGPFDSRAEAISWFCRGGR